MTDPKVAQALGDGPLMTIPDVAEGLNQSRATVYQHIKAGRLEAIKIGGATRVTRKSYSMLIDNAPRLKPSPPASQPVTV